VKAHKPYEFGNKIGITTLPGSKVVIGIASFRGNLHDSITMLPTLAYVEIMTEKRFKYVLADRGYTGAKGLEKIRLIKHNPLKNKGLNRYQRDKRRKQCSGRSTIEPIIGHMKSSCMVRNYLKGKSVDLINALLAAVAFNFIKRMNFCIKIYELFLSN